MSEENKGLTFAPLGWIYNDAWRWRETKKLIDYDDQGNKVLIDSGKTLYNRGHCHLFLPGVNFSKNGSQQMYWGNQTYQFNVVDEWGPNSNDPVGNQSEKLIGKPIWYFHIEEYWRRMYIQPWDAVDMTCELPLNQSVQYETKTWDDHLRSLLESNDLVESKGQFDLDTVLSKTDSGVYVAPEGLGFTDYLQARRRIEARRLFVKAQWTDYAAWYKESKDETATDAPENDSTYLEYIKAQKTTPDTDEDDSPETTYTREAAFEEFFNGNASRYEGYVDYRKTLEEFLAMRSIETRPSGSKIDQDGNIRIPTGEKVGHVGIKYDASKPCHSLGPFREGGEFYFFNTVVNRTMPCEYWLDENRRRRQYYLKQSAEGVETSGGGTWTFGGDSSKFHWVFDTFADAERTLGALYEPGGWVISKYGYEQHRMEALMPSNEYYVFAGMNAKRLRTDHFLNIKDVKRIGDSWTQIAGESDSMTEAQRKWIGDNSNLVPSQYDEAGYAEHYAEVTNAIEKEPVGEYTDYGWVESETQPSDMKPSDIPESANAIHWEKRRWSGWYEKGEMIKGPDGKWYRRDWAPYGYQPGGDMGESEEWPVQPFWSRQKRQHFPNPSPWLCDGSKTDPAAMLSRFPYPVPEHFATSCPYKNADDNRRHLLHWEYAQYFSLVWKYTDTGAHYTSINDDVVVPETAIAWEEFLDTYNSDNGRYPETIEEEDSVFSQWIATVAEECMLPYQDKYVYYDENLDPIQPERIEYNNRRYIVYSMDLPDGTVENTYAVLPDPIYTVAGYSYTKAAGKDGNLEFHWGFSNMTRTYLSFDEFSTVWHQLTDAETRSLGLDGDMPKRNDTPYRTFTEEAGTLAEYFTEEDSFDPDTWEWMDGEREFKLGDLNDEQQAQQYDDDIPIGPEPDEQSQDDEEEKQQQPVIPAINASALAESAKSAIQTSFFPRVDEETWLENERRSRVKPNGLPPFPISPLDETGDNIEQSVWDSKDVDEKKKYLRYYVETGQPIDPYRDGKVDPIKTWKNYFSHREEFTIPETTTVLGDRSISNPKSTPNTPMLHPRETSYSHEDGARRMYPDDMFVTPIIEYQRVVRTNSSVNPEGYIRLAGKEREAADMGMWLSVPDENGSYQNENGNWTTDKNGNWGDGFEVTVQIPYRINGEIQSPFSDAARRVSPPGEYHHDCVKPEDKMRYHIEFYDSLEQIWRYDFPNYVNIIRAFQLEHMPEGLDDDEDFTKSYYREDFNDHDATLKYRKNEKAENIPENCKCWQEALDKYWLKIDATNHFSDHPIVRDYDCYGHNNEFTKGNVFVPLADRTQMWRERTTYMMPTIDKVEYMTDEHGDRVPGYLDSKGNRVKGGKVVEWNNPFKDQQDGKWVEQCLGAIVKAKCYMILEDGFETRRIVEISSTAMTSTDPLRGSDYR